MKLIDLLVKELPKRGGWPDGVAAMAQDADGAVQNYRSTEYITIDAEHAAGISRIACSYSILPSRVAAASDRLTAIITREQYESALAASDGWIDWGGGRCPVEPIKRVDVRFMDGGDDRNIEAKNLYWDYNNWSADIIAYRLHKPDINSRANDARLVQDLNECIGQDVDPAWNGDGLPPVGTICEALMPALNHEAWHWRTVKVVESGIPGAEKEVLAYDIENTRPAWVDEFRPLRTKAERKRDAFINLLHGEDSPLGKNRLFRETAEAIYDAIAAGKIPGVKLEGK